MIGSNEFLKLIEIDKSFKNVEDTIIDLTEKGFIVWEYIDLYTRKVYLAGNIRIKYDTRSNMLSVYNNGGYDGNEKTCKFLSRNREKLKEVIERSLYGENKEFEYNEVDRICVFSRRKND